MHRLKKVILLSLASSILLGFGKFIAYFITGSNVILTDAAESLINILASTFAFYSVNLSSRPKDFNHPYGHGKVEFFSMFVEGALIVCAGLFAIGKSIYNFYYPNAIGSLLDGAFILAVTSVINIFLGRYLIKQGNKHGSLSIYSDGKHLLIDAYNSIGCVAGILLIYCTGIFFIDNVLSIAIGLYVIHGGYKLVRKSVGGLMDESDIYEVKKLIETLNKNRREAWIDIHNLRLQRYGNKLHIDCHLTLPYYFSLSEAHEEVKRLDEIVNQQSLFRIEFFVHMDPCLFKCCHYCRMSACGVRFEEKTKDLVWTLQNTTQDKKHFD